jgi:DNA-binding NtrC family response regulator
MARRPLTDVLVVEDDAVTSALVLHLLGEAGLTTDSADSVAATRKLLAENAYKVLVLDLLLPDGTGVEILDFIKSENLGPLPVIVITAADATMIGQLDRSLVKSVMLKPMHVQLLIASIRELTADRTVPMR